MRGGIRGKYAQRVRESSNIVVLEPDIAEAFPTEDAVNGALRALLNERVPTDRHPVSEYRVKDQDGIIRRKRSDALVKTLRETYGEDFAPGYRHDTPLSRVLEDAGVDTLSEYLRRNK